MRVSTRTSSPNKLLSVALSVRFATDSALEGGGFEPSVPLYGELGAGACDATRAAIVKPGTPDRASTRSASDLPRQARSRPTTSLWAHPEEIAAG